MDNSTQIMPNHSQISTPQRYSKISNPNSINLNNQNTTLKDEKSDKNNKILTYSLIGLGLAGAAILLIKKHKGKSSVDSSDIPKTNADKPPHTDTKPPIKTGSGDLGVEELTLKGIDSIDFKHPETLKETLPEFMKYQKELKLHEPADFVYYFQHITPENKDFYKKEGIKAIAENFEKIENIEKDVAASIFGKINKQNVKMLPHLLDKASELQIKDGQKLETILSHFKPEHNSEIIEETFPTFFKHIDKFDNRNGSEAEHVGNKFTHNIKRILDLVHSEKKDTIMNEAFPIFIENAEKLKEMNGNRITLLSHLNNKNKHLLTNLMNDKDKFLIKNTADLNSYLKVITPKNEKNMLDKHIPFVLTNKDKLKLTSSSSIAKISNQVNLGLDNEVKLVINNSEKFKNFEEFIPKHLILGITHENKSSLPIVLDNMEKLEVNTFFCEDEHKDLLDKGVDGIKKMLEE